MNISTIQSVDTIYSADSVEWCPYQNYQQYFVCGTYHLEENKTDDLALPTRRKGRIYLYKFVLKELTQLDAQETAAILDLKWCQLDTKPILAAANALGEVMLYTIADDKLELLSSMHLNADIDNLLTLAIDWNSKRLSDSDRRLVASDSKGNISLLQLTSTRLDTVHSWNAHSFEAWTCCFDRFNQNVIYSGGDDSFMHGYDVRESSKIFTNKSHMAGVTTFLSFETREHMLATGSYDEKLRIFDMRSHKQPLAEFNLNGGVWRIKEDPFGRNLLLCACMYHNFSIVQLSESLKELELVAEYFEHKSICYGADWCCEPSDSADLLMATCSFYDQKLCISSVREK